MANEVVEAARSNAAILICVLNSAQGTEPPELPPSPAELGASLPKEPLLLLLHTFSTGIVPAPTSTTQVCGPWAFPASLARAVPLLTVLRPRRQLLQRSVSISRRFGTTTLLRPRMSSHFPVFPGP